MARIEFNFERAKQQAKKLEETAREMKRLGANSIDNTLVELRSSWSGENADAYILKGRTLQQQLAETAQELENIAESIRRVAQAIYEAEMRAREIVQQRSY